jgi:hypothetical protein
MAKKAVSSLVAQIKQLEKSALVVDMAMNALPIEKRVQLFNDWIPTSVISDKALLRIMRLSSFDVAPVIPTLAAPCVIRIKGPGYLQEGDGQNFLKSSNKATRYVDQKSLAFAIKELKDDGWDADAIEVKSVDKV